MDSHAVAETLAVHVPRELDPDSSTRRHVRIVGEWGTEDDRGRWLSRNWRCGDFDRSVRRSGCQTNGFPCDPDGCCIPLYGPLHFEPLACVDMSGRIELEVLALRPQAR